jgi:hypothetical protein
VAVIHVAGECRLEESRSDTGVAGTARGVGIQAGRYIDGSICADRWNFPSVWVRKSERRGGAVVRAAVWSAKTRIARGGGWCAAAYRL